MTNICLLINKLLDFFLIGKKYFFLLILIFFCINISAQSPKLDSLRNVLKKVRHDTARIKIYLGISDFYDTENPDSALKYNDIALQLTEKNIKNTNTENTVLDVLYFLKAIALCNMGVIYSDQGNYDKSREFYNKSINIYEQILVKYKDRKDQGKITEGKKGMSSCYINLGEVYCTQGSYDTAIAIFRTALKIAQEINDKKIMAMCYNNIGVVYVNQGIYDKAIECYIHALKIKEEVGDKKGMSSCYTNIGNVQYFQKQYDMAFEYYMKALKIFEELGDKKRITKCYINIGNVVSDKGDNEKAIEYYLKALKIAEEMNDKKGMSACYMNIGSVNSDQKIFEKALEYFLKALKIKEELGDKNGIVTCYINIGSMNKLLSDSGAFSKNQKLNYLNQAITFGTKAILLAQEIKAMPMENLAAKTLMGAYRSMGDYKKSMEYAEIYIATKDSMFGEEKTRSLTEMETKYKAEKKQLEIDKLSKEKLLQLSENKKQKIIIVSIVAGLFLLIVFAVFIVNRLQITRRQKNIIETQKDEIEAQRDLVTHQKQQIEGIHEELTDSIRYAERIQRAVLPGNKYIESRMQYDFFILYKPKNIVSGDFYFVEKRKENLFIAVADCTGHGVPGAFMSMLGMSFLNEIISKDEELSAGSVLDELRKYVIQSLQQKGIDGEQQEGMDISLLKLNTKTLFLEYSGAGNPCWIVSTLPLLVGSPQIEENISIVNSQQTANSFLHELKPDKMPVGIFEEMNPFKTHKIKVNNGDQLYLFSDGFVDQFGNDSHNGTHKKFLAKRFKELLLSIADLTMAEQREKINMKFENWKGMYEQIDDVTVLGMKL